MRKGRGICLGFFFVIAACVTASTITSFLEFTGMILKTGIEAMTRVSLSQYQMVSVTNYVAEWLLTRDIVHMIFESFIVTVVAMWMFFSGRCEDLVMQKETTAYFLVFFLVSTISLEVISYFAYVLQFVLDAIVAGITSREQSVTLLNIISFQRFGEIDFFGRLCEGFIFARIFFLIKSLILKHMRHKRLFEQERAEMEAREAAREEEERRRKAARVGYRSRSRELYNVLCEYEASKPCKEKPVLFLESK